MVLTLRDLQRTMDPGIAGQVYNNNYSPIIRLPNELLLYILHCLGDDIIALLCLLLVSRIFRHLIKEPDIWIYVLAASLPYESWHSRNYLLCLPRDVRKQYRQRLYRDGMCNQCKLWCNVPIQGWEQRSRATYQCQFETLGLPRQFGTLGLPRQLYCNACDSYHDELEFSKSNQNLNIRERQCLGREGAVQLCEHVHISWATIEAHIADWQPRNPRDWQDCLNHFNVKCYDPSHDTRCSDEESPTWPQACLQSSIYDDNLVLLNLEWKPHSGLNAFTPTPDGQAPASELRTLFSRYRQGAAGIIFLSYPSNPLPEMACFRFTRGCSCLHYKRGESSAANSLKYPTFSCKNWFSISHSNDRG